MERENQKKLLIFDLDGTISDTLPSIAEAVNLCARHFGYPEKSNDEVRRAVGNGVGVLLRQTMPEDVVNDPERFAEVKKYFAECYEQTQSRLNTCYDGMLDALHELYNRGYTLAVLSNKPDKLVQMIIKNIFPDGIISLCAGQTDLPRKPDPTVPLAFAEHFGVSPESTYFIGDSEVDVLTARNAGMIAVAVSWGFRGRDILEASSPDALIDTREELFEYLLSQA